VDRLARAIEDDDVERAAIAIGTGHLLDPSWDVQWE
jgi:hypothetical protein